MSDQEAGVVTPSDDAVLTKEQIQQLGRARPAIFKTWFSEVAFVFTVVTSMMTSEFFISGFNIILPPVAESLKIPDSARTWPASAINIATAGLLLPFSRLCDIYGGRYVFLAGHAWMCVWSLICGFSKSPEMLIVCRAMQGVGAAAFVPASLALLGQTYRPGPRKNLVFSIWGALACVGFYSGIFIAAVSASFITWRWFFWIGAIIVSAIVVSGWFSIPHATGIDKSIKMDWLGIITIVPGLVLIVFPFTDAGQAPNGWRTPYIYVTLIIGVLFLAVAVYVQGWVSKQPFLPGELFKPKYMKRLIVILFCAYGIFGLFLFYASFYMETVLHTTPIQTAAWFTPLAVGGMVLAICGGFVMHVIPNTALMVISGLGFLLSVLLFALIPADGKSKSFLYWAYIFPAMLGGTIGVDITFNVTNVFITTAMPHRLQASASGLINSLLYLGISFWLGVGEMAVSLAKENQGDSLGLRGQYQIGFWVGVALAGVMLALTATVRLGAAEASLTADELAKQEQNQQSQELLTMSQEKQTQQGPATLEAIQEDGKE